MLAEATDIEAMLIKLSGAGFMCMQKLLSSFVCELIRLGKMQYLTSRCFLKSGSIFIIEHRSIRESLSVV